MDSAILALEDGAVFEGRSFGAPAERSGEVVFNTAITGYQEIFTDPSCTGQIVILTNSQIGNYVSGYPAREFPRPTPRPRVPPGAPSPGATPGLARRVHPTLPGVHPCA